MLLTLIITVVIVAASVLVSNVILFSRFVDENFEDSLERATREILNEINVLERNVASITAIYLANDAALINTIMAGDYDALAARAHELFLDLGLEMFSVTDRRGVVIAQPHSPDFAGFYLTAMRSVRHALMGGVPVATVEGGSAVSLMVNSSSPIRDAEGTIIGAVLVGFRLDTPEFVERHRYITGTEIALFRGTESVATTLLNNDGTPVISLTISDEIHHAVVFNGETFTSEMAILGHNMLARFTPIVDTYGNVAAILFAGHFLADKMSVVQSFILTGIAVTAVLLGLSVLIIRIVSARIANPIDKKLDQLHIDPLTGIYNRRYFNENYKTKIDILTRSHGVLTVAIIDIDHFKNYNDTYGHGGGDECLRVVAQALTTAVMREGDFVARYGGEEFVAVFPNTNEEGARTIAQRLIDSVRECNIPHEGSRAKGQVTISIGIATGFIKKTEHGDALLKLADKLCYTSKDNGRDQYSLGKLE